MENEPLLSLSESKKTYSLFIKTILEMVEYLEIDELMKMTLSSHDVKLIGVDDPNIINHLTFIEKNHIYCQLWKETIFKVLNEGFLPQSPYELDWDIEITPFSLSMLQEMKTTTAIEAEITLLKERLNLTDDDIENKLEDLAAKIGLDIKYIEKIPERLRPKTNREQLIQLIKLMQFPPLEDLALFYNRYFHKTKQDIQLLGSALANREIDNYPEFTETFSLHHSYFHLNHNSFKKHGLDYFENHPDLERYKPKFKKIREKAAKEASNHKDTAICPCCGEPLSFTLPQEILQYKLILNDRELSKACGFVCFEEYFPEIKKSAAESILNYFKTINSVKEPKCLILVEGSSEENALPVLALRKLFNFRAEKIQVYNSSSKEQLFRDFKAFKKQFPDLKMICLLDSDAKKERDDIVRMIKNLHNKYHLVYIETGTFEDIFDLEVAVKVLNEMYPEGETITVSDFSKGIRFEKSADKILKAKKLASFDKVKFATAISIAIPTDNYPKEVTEIFEKAKQFTTKKKYVKE